MTPPPIRAVARIRIAVDYAVLRADVRERFTFAAVALSARILPALPIGRRDGGTFLPSRLS